MSRLGRRFEDHGCLQPGREQIERLDAPALKAIAGPA
jgi:hypothetical protein